MYIKMGYMSKLQRNIRLQRIHKKNKTLFLLNRLQKGGLINSVGIFFTYVGTSIIPRFLIQFT